MIRPVNSKTFNSVCGRTHLITFKKFLEKLNIQPHYGSDHNQDYVLFDTMISNGFAFAEQVAGGEPPYYETTESMYMRCKAYVYKNPCPRSLLVSLIYQAKHTNLSFAPLGEILEDLCVKHAENFGTPEYLVRIGPRQWLPADARDFKIYKTDRGSALACICGIRTVVFYVNRRPRGTGNESEGYFRYGGLHIRQAKYWGRGHDGSAGGTDIDLDFCSNCCKSFDEWRSHKANKDLK